MKPEIPPHSPYEVAIEMLEWLENKGIMNAALLSQLSTTFSFACEVHGVPDDAFAEACKNMNEKYPERREATTKALEIVQKAADATQSQSKQPS